MRLGNTFGFLPIPEPLGAYSCFIAFSLYPAAIRPHKRVDLASGAHISYNDDYGEKEVLLKNRWESRQGGSPRSQGSSVVEQHLHKVMVESSILSPGTTSNVAYFDSPAGCLSAIFITCSSCSFASRAHRGCSKKQPPPLFPPWLVFLSFFFFIGH